MEEDVIIKDHIFIWQKDRYKKIALDTIILIKADRSYCEIITIGNNSYVLSVPLADVCRKIEDSKFLRIHRSYMINIDFVESLMGNIITTTNGLKLTIGREYRSIVFRKFIFVGAHRGIDIK